MKKISLYVSLALAGLFVSSCGDEYEPWADPQSNPQEAAITIPGLTASAVAAQDLATVGDSVPTFTLASATLPDGFSLQNARIELTPQGVEGATTTTVTTALNGKTLTSDLQGLIEGVYGKRPEARKFDAQVYINAVKDGQAMLIDAGKIVVTATPKAPKIAANYYVIGGALDWAQSATGKVQKFSHSDKDVYDDPTFTITIPAAYDNGVRTDTWFAFGDDEACEAIGNNDWSKVLGTANGNGSTELSGSLKTRAELGNDGSIHMPANDGAKFYRITLNMMDYKYTIEALNFAEYFYLVGADTGWGDGSWAMVSPNSDGKYKAYCYLSGEFKFKPNAADWSGDLEYNGEGRVADIGGSNIPAPEAGFYMVDFDFGALTYKLTKFEDMRIVGDAAPGGWDAGDKMTYDKATHTWNIKGVTLGEGKQLKFRSGADWSCVDLGGSLTKLTQGASNIVIAKGGKYDITLHLENANGYPYAELTEAK